MLSQRRCRSDPVSRRHEAQASASVAQTARSSDGDASRRPRGSVHDRPCAVTRTGATERNASSPPAAEAAERADGDAAAPHRRDDEEAQRATAGDRPHPERPQHRTSTEWQHRKEEKEDDDDEEEDAPEMRAQSPGTERPRTESPQARLLPTPPAPPPFAPPPPSPPRRDSPILPVPHSSGLARERSRPPSSRAPKTRRRDDRATAFPPVSAPSGPAALTTPPAALRSAPEAPERPRAHERSPRSPPSALQPSPPGIDDARKRQSAPRNERKNAIARERDER